MNILSVVVATLVVLAYGTVGVAAAEGSASRVDRTILIDVETDGDGETDIRLRSTIPEAASTELGTDTKISDVTVQERDETLTISIQWEDETGDTGELFNLTADIDLSDFDEDEPRTLPERARLFVDTDDDRKWDKTYVLRVVGTRVSGRN